jgi:Cu-Zn family superoxide dismutase
MKLKFLANGLFLGSLFAIAMSCNNAGSDSEGDTTVTEGIDTTSGSSNAAKAAHADVTATKSDTAGQGTAHFTQKDDGTVELDLQISFPKMANKSVAVHLHEHGDCGDAGNGAHGHWNPTNENHGKWGEGQYHSGDIGNIQLNGEGKGEIKVSSNRWTIGGDDKTNILNRAVIVHSGVDDYKTQPSGNAGSRIGCGVIGSM